jgi:hypothetical protein
MTELAITERTSYSDKGERRCELSVLNQLKDLKETDHTLTVSNRQNLTIVPSNLEGFYATFLPNYSYLSKL